LTQLIEIKVTSASMNSCRDSIDKPLITWDKEDLCLAPGAANQPLHIKFDFAIGAVWVTGRTVLGAIDGNSGHLRRPD